MSALDDFDPDAEYEAEMERRLEDKTPQNNELERLLWIYKEDIKFLHYQIKNQGLTPDEILTKEDMVTDKAKAKLESLITAREIEARLEELRYVDYSCGEHRTYINGEHRKQTISERLKQLEAKLKLLERSK